MKLVIDEQGNEVMVDETKRKLYTFSNKDREIVWNAPDIKLGFWINYTEEGTVDDVELKLQAWNNAILLAYSKVVNFHAAKYDPDRKIWNGLVDVIKANPSEYFDEYGDFKYDLKMSDDDIRRLVNAKESN